MSPVLGAGPVGNPAGAVPSGGVKPHQVQVRSKDGRTVLTGTSGPDPAEISGGRGGWETVQRNRRPPVTQWVGSGARETTMIMWVDGWGQQKSVEADLRLVDVLAPPVPPTEPPVVFVVGSPGVASTIPWVINEVAISERLRLPNGQTARAQVTFTMLEYRPADLVVSKTSTTQRSAERNRTPTAGKPKTYTVRSGDTLSAIAARTLGKASRWPEIASLNGLRNPNSLQVGKALKLPA